MVKSERFHLGFNWSTSRETAFTRAVAEAAKHRGLRWLRVLKSAAPEIRQRVSDGRLEVGLFLNTQADGTDMDSPHMLLCRSLKASGSLVVEDPDDAPVYASRAIQLDYLEKAGLPVPRRLMIRHWKPDKPVLTAAEQVKIGRSWLAQPAVGLGRRRALAGTGRLTSSMLSKSGFAPRQGVLIYSNHELKANKRVRFRIWHLFGHVVCCFAQGQGTFELLRAGSPSSDFVPRLTALVHRVAQITGLDWFASEFTSTKRTGRAGLTIWEPANALALLGPGVKPLAELPDEVTRILAERLVEVAWRHAHRLPLADGVTVRV
jgi:hypothetical protein